MQFERLVIEAGDHTFTVDFHERLTVIAGLGQLEREGLVNELIGALSSSRSGVHLEMVSDAGNRFAIFRPEGARHRVVDIDQARDVTDAFQMPSGSIDLLAKAGMEVTEAKRLLRVSASDLTSGSETEHFIQALAQVEQGRLWELAEKVQDRERRLNEAAEAAGSVPEDAEVISRIEQAQREFEEAQRRHERVRAASFYGSFLSIVAAIPAAMFAPVLVVVPFIVVAVAAACVSVAFYRQVERAREAAEDALSQVGASSYLTFHLQRVNGLLTSDQARRDLMRAAEEHRAALAQWELIAGDATVEFAVAHRAEIRDAARELGAPNRVGVVAPQGPPVAASSAQGTADALLARIGEVRRLGPGGESFPIVLDDPLRELPDEAKGDVLARVARATETQQVILLTEDPAIEGWARLEAMTGDLSLVAPATEEVRPSRSSKSHAAA